MKIQPHPTTVEVDKPRGRAVVPPLPCPEEYIAQMRQPLDEPRQLRRTFIRGRTPEASTVGTTWFAPDACLGSVNRSSFWTQRKPVIGYWRSDADPAVVFRVRFLHDGRDFASMGLRTAQEGPRVLATFHSLTDRGDWHRTLDRPADGRFTCSDLRLRFELRGEGVTADRLGAGRFALAAGDRRIVVHTAPARFDGRDVIWQLGREPGYVYLDSICHTGEARQFDFSAPIEMTLAAGIELLHDGEQVSNQPPRARPSSGTAATWMAGGKLLTMAAE